MKYLLKSADPTGSSLVDLMIVEKDISLFKASSV